ncbi:hypothetical protein EPUS_04332 [Endocarpon pusillum Z07020]|uniref:cyclin-dependent kinase n=1 Tax=Endocarpon pusillum (strain Z07020 / HMAS-L-300199) TaxID=1263415 RepID=U1HZC1_ENDPU|nr:uncharacterized protein EPUS_04332 [Endocarpon pusillum Z07020]ERF76255.1 hypothetical protein EPUS_04332 [Endocarpon pusillum Z07020]
MGVTNSLDSTVAQAYAKELEGQIYDQVTSKDEYDTACTNKINELKQQSPLVESRASEPEADGLYLQGPDYGPYRKATFYKHGRFSSVFKAVDKDQVDDMDAPTSNLVALKVTTPSAMTPPHDSEREARILQEARSESVIQLLSTMWQPGGRLVLVFPFVPVDLETLMQSSSVEQKDVKSIARDLFKALSHLHSLQIIHRDVKPSNILLRSQTGPAYLADFGIAWSPNDPASEPAQEKITDVGTTSYRPPELLFGYKAYDTSLDLWAAGCTVAEMIRPYHRSIFDAGDLGSELALIRSIFSTLGTPDEESWPSVKQFPDWGKMRFVDYPAKPWSTILDGAIDLEVEFVSSLVQYEATRRMTAAQALSHTFLKEVL